MIKIGENILSWCPDIDENTLEQAKNVSNHPFLIGNICLMPDSHFGFGVPIGSVIALDGAICPNMVGVDIGCGMHSVKTELKKEDLLDGKLKHVLSKIREDIPLGFNHHKTDIYKKEFLDDLPELNHSLKNVFNNQTENLHRQLCTLGGGNHFLEFQTDSEDNIWITIHSGSRNIGHSVASYYNKVAEELCLRWRHRDSVENKLAFLPIGTKEAENYINDMNYCLFFANLNRQLMMNVVLRHLECSIHDTIQIHHNYANLENHYGKNVWVHRKGAVCARKGAMGIIPGSQGTNTYITRGLGKESSLHSSSHGAGRVLSRKKAVESLSLEDEVKKLDSMGIIHSIRHEKDLEEAPSAYKDIRSVMENQKDLTEIICELTPIAVIKG